GRGVLADVLEGARLVVQAAREERAQRAQVGGEHARRVALRRRAARVGDERRQRPRVLLLLDARESDQLVLHERAAAPEAGVLGGESARVEGQPGRLGADVAVVTVAI